MSGLPSIAESYEQYRKLVWPHVDQNTAQMHTIKGVFFAAWFDAITTLDKAAQEMNEEQMSEWLDRRLEEAKKFIVDDIMRGSEQSRRPLGEA